MREPAESVIRDGKAICRIVHIPTAHTETVRKSRMYGCWIGSLIGLRIMARFQYSRTPRRLPPEDGEEGCLNEVVFRGDPGDAWNGAASGLDAKDEIRFCLPAGPEGDPNPETN